MNELTGFSLQPFANTVERLTSRSLRCAVGWESGEAVLGFPLFHAPFYGCAVKTLSSKHTPWRSRAQTAVNSLRARAILATCAGFRWRNRAIQARAAGECRAATCATCSMIQRSVAEP